MKKQKIILLSMFFTYAFLNMNSIAQVKLCLEGGLNFSDVSYSGLLEAGPNGKRTGGILGASFEFYTSKGFSLQLGARVIQKGCTYSNSAVEITERIDYLEIPVNANLKLQIGRFEPFISAGFYYSARISGTQVQKYSSGEKYEYDMNELYDNSDFGGLAGAGVEFKLTKKINLFLFGSYSIGIVNNLADERFGYAYNKGVQLLTGVKFTL